MEVPLSKPGGLPPAGAPASPPGGTSVDPPLPPRRPPARPPPKKCSGRVLARGADGRLVETAIEADVLHIFEGFLDVALLQVRQRSTSRSAGDDGNATGVTFCPLPWRDKSAPAEGAEVWAVGHGLFGPGRPWPGPSMTHGHVVKVATGARTLRPAVLQTSAAVHRGCSGGALVEVATGELVGLITTNVKHQDGTVMPHVNFSLPVMLLAPLRQFLNETSDGPHAVEALAKTLELCAADEQEQSLWRLEPEPLDLPSRIDDRKQQAIKRMQELGEDASSKDSFADSSPSVAVGGNCTGKESMPSGQPPLRPPKSCL